MEEIEFDPLVHLRDDGLQLSYEFPYRVYDAKVYPIQAPNGSTVIIYGHENGVRILWRGGRRIKPHEGNGEDAKKEESKAKAGNDDVIMIIDSDEEDDPPAQQKEAVPTVQYEEEEDEIDPRRPFQSIIESFNIHLGVKVRKVSIPSILPDAMRPVDSVPPVLTSMIVFTAACADSSIRLIAAPLALPPADGPYLWDFQTLTIPAQHVQVDPAIITMTLTCEKPDIPAETQSRARGKQSTPSKPPGTWKLLLAIHSMEASGKLSIYQIAIDKQPIQAPYPYKLSADDLVPVQQMYLKSPAKSISFHPSQYPSDHHTHLLVAFENGKLDLYQLFPPASRASTLSERRRPTAATRPKQAHAKCFFTLYTNFDESSANLMDRKRIVDAKWVLGGRAIMVLTTDGEWGLWDMEMSGPDRQNPTTATTFSAYQLTTFALRGRVTSPEVSSRSHPTNSTSTAGQNKTKFAPMTPSTRRIREEVLFKGTPQRPAVSSHSYRGAISVIPVSRGWDKLGDESILIWHGDKNVQIPSLITLWKSSVQPSDVVLESSNKYKPAIIQDIKLLGEMENGICYIPSHFRSAATKDPRLEILITAETRLLILASKLQAPEDAKEDEEMQDQNVANEHDQMMLQRGELDLDGMDRVLANMANNTPGTRPNLLRSSQNAFFA
ncbi:hypothetical protein D8B26_005424 [Coccidioides posadasii str. Silveira]|uniref:Uncharacterized protein n=1 Tax=Coccidioides posadasii (strain RMSCC 757 / Silveira) TaxID=443226 RepID=E9DJU5_COCPS|nr:conserved hypothetical protein [Coccidioides posadasii str. Silveira]QVM10771.1 hypothetical protein D8B26_005424 [Coccidioides posadasii str. Silveira]